jgi:hypothetical protein
LVIGLGVVLASACGDDGGGGDTGAGTESMGMTSAGTMSTMSSSATTQGSDSDSATSDASSSGAGTSEATSTTSGATTSGGMSSSDDAATMSSDSSSMCSNEGQSCAQGEACCANLNCCVGVPVPPGAEYCSAQCPDSDRNLKENFATVDPHDVLARVAALPITTWTYESDPAAARHLGPMAQDFKAAFELGATDRAIHKIDADGVALAAIQALHADLEATRAENAALHERITALESRLDQLTGLRSP